MTSQTSPSVTYKPMALLPAVLDIRYWAQRVRINVSKLSLRAESGNDSKEIPLDGTSINVGQWSVNAKKFDYAIYLYARNTDSGTGELQTLKIVLNNVIAGLFILELWAPSGFTAFSLFDDNGTAFESGVAKQGKENIMVFHITKVFGLKSNAQGGDAMIWIYPLEIVE